MQLKRAAGMSVVAYLASLLFGFLSARIFQFDAPTSLHPPWSGWIFSLLGTAAITVGVVWWYFYNRDANPKEGFFLSLAMIAISFFLDGLLLIPYFLLGNDPGYLFAYYTTPLFWVSLIMILIISPLTAVVRKKQQNIIRQKAGYEKM